MFLTFAYGVMYVLSFATIITVFATASRGLALTGKLYSGDAAKASVS